MFYYLFVCVLCCKLVFLVKWYVVFRSRENRELKVYCEKGDKIVIEILFNG